MTTYLDLKAQAEALLQQAEELRKAEVKSVIDEIKAKMAQYDLTVEDLGSKRFPVKKPAPVKYRGLNGEEWTGRGRTPTWMKEAIAQGMDKEMFAV